MVLFNDNIVRSQTIQKFLTKIKSFLLHSDDGYIILHSGHSIALWTTFFSIFIVYFYKDHQSI